MARAARRKKSNALQPGADVFGYRVHETHEYGHRSVVIEIYKFKVISVDETIDGAIDNKAGYGEGGAERVLSYFTKLKGLGHDIYLEKIMGSTVLVLKWSIFEPYYADERIRYTDYVNIGFEPSHVDDVFEGTQRLREIGASIETERARVFYKKFYRRLPTSSEVKEYSKSVRNSTFSNPTEVIATLETKPWNMVRFESHTDHDGSWNRIERVVARGPRMFLLTDTLISIFTDGYGHV